MRPPFLSFHLPIKQNNPTVVKDCFLVIKNLLNHFFISTLPKNPITSPIMTQLQVVLNKFYDEYVHNTSKKLKLIDAYLVYIVLTGITQFVYCCLVGSFPFNSFLSGFISTVSCFILGGKWIILIILFIAFYCGLLFSLSATSSESTKQGHIPRDYSRTWIRWLHPGSCDTSHCCHEFPGIKYCILNQTHYQYTIHAICTIHKLYIQFYLD